METINFLEGKLGLDTLIIFLMVEIFILLTEGAILWACARDLAVWQFMELFVILVLVIPKNILS